MQRLRIALLATSALIPLSDAVSLGNPLGPDVTAGDVTMDGLGSTDLTVNQTSSKAIVDWRSFNIDSGETTTFVQPGSDAVILNRVTGGEGASQILGSLHANGQVFLVNPDGILIGRDATVDVGALVATTHDLFDGDFLSGHYEFGLAGKPDASVVNLGTITVNEGGFAALVAPGVRNAGTITARLGKVSLASASSFSLDPYGDGLVTLGLSNDTADEIIDVATGKPLSALVGNDGLIAADGGVVQLTAAATRKVIDAAVNNSGTIEADTVGTRNGKIVLSAGTASTKPVGTPTQKVRVSGKLLASGENDGELGGRVQITGEEIALLEATIDAYGWKGGGQVLVGGDIHGGRRDLSAPNQPQPIDESLPVASAVSMDSLSRIDASATSAGGGGEVVIWSEGLTIVDGFVAARGGAVSGAGGFVETSGKTLQVGDYAPNATSADGPNGTWLLDPLNVAIRNATDINYTASGVLGTITVKPSASGSVINASTINIALSAGVNVVVSTLGTAGAEAGDISLEANIASTSSTPGLFQLSAAGSVIVSPGVSITSASQLALWWTAGNVISAGNLGSVSTQNGLLFLTGPNGISYGTPSPFSGKLEVSFGTAGGNSGVVSAQFANARVGFDYSNGTMFFRRYGTDITPLSFTEFNATGISNIVLSNMSFVGGSNWAFPGGFLPSWSIGVTPSDFADGVPEVISPPIPPTTFSDPPSALSIPLLEQRTSSNGAVQFSPTSPRGVSLLAMLGTPQAVQQAVSSASSNEIQSSGSRQSTEAPTTAPEPPKQAPASAIPDLVMRGGIKVMTGTNVWTGESKAVTAYQLLRDVQPYEGFAAAAYEGTNWTQYAREMGLSPEDINFLEFRGFQASVSTYNGKIILAFAGTNDQSDWIYTNIPNGIDNLLSRYFPGHTMTSGKQFQYMIATALAQVVRANNPGIDIRLTGHSLGGGMAAYVGATLGIPAVTFNPAGISFAPGESHNDSMVLNFEIGTDRAGVGDIVGSDVVFSESLLVPTSASTGMFGNFLGIPKIVDRHDLDNFVDLAYDSRSSELAFTGSTGADLTGAIHHTGTTFYASW